MMTPPVASRTLVTDATIVTMDAAGRVLPRGAVEVGGSRIVAIHDDSSAARRGFAGEVVDAAGLVLIPGFVQTHVHLCQTLFRGLADDLDLMDWLRLRIFPFEAAHDAASMAASARAGLAELLRSGTTTIMDMGSVRHEEEIAEAVTGSGIRAFIGKSLIDLNDLHPPLKEPSRAAIDSAREQALAWHGSANGRVRYAVAPRFVLSCTDGLLKEAHAMTGEFPGMLFHTHAAENRREMEAVHARCGMGNIEHFDALGVLGRRSCLAHCVHLGDREAGLLAERDAAVLHCPSSNLMLGSGVAPVPALRRAGVRVSLGADGAACNNTLDMFREMRLASAIQRPIHGPAALRARDVLAMATIGGAAALGIDSETGSVEAGKNADLLLLDLRHVWNPCGEGFGEPEGAIVYTGSPENVTSVMIDGRWVYRNRRHLTLDPDRAAARAREELRRLTARLNP
jgi:cytosine/adenosine deaminase-related metal-dependent hydrolase